MLDAIRGDELADKDAAETSADLMEFVKRLGCTRNALTVGNYLLHLSAVLVIAPSAFAVDVDRHAMADALAVGKRLGLVAKSQRCERWPPLDEFNRLMAHFGDWTIRRGALPMQLIVAFAIFSTRRQEEITRTFGPTCSRPMTDSPRIS